MKTPLPDSFLRKMSPEDRRGLGKAGRTFEEIGKATEYKTEKELQEHMASVFRLHGIKFNRSRMDKRKTDVVGWPDFTFAIRGMACAMEAKVGSNALDADQVICITEMQLNGWQVWVVRSVADQVRILRELKALT